MADSSGLRRRHPRKGEHMSGPTREQVRSLTTQAVRMTVDDFAINGFAIPKDIEANITEKYEFIYYLVKFAQEQERERSIQFLQEMQRQVGDAHNHYGHAALRIKERT